MVEYCLSPTFTIEKTIKFSVISNRWLIDNSKKVFVLLDLNCAYSNNIVSNALRRRPWSNILSDLESISTDKVLSSSLNNNKIVQLCDFENIQWENVLLGKHHASSYIIRKGLSRKAQFALQMKKYLCKNSKSILKTAIPYTTIVDTWNAFDNMRLDFGRGTFASFDATTMTGVPLRTRLEWCLDDVRQEFESRDKLKWLWILKPSVTNKGLGINIIDKWDKLLDVTENSSDIREWVLQRYISNPLLVQGHKFHLRVYILCVGALQVYVYNNILMLLAAYKYDLHDHDNIHRHLTNTARAIEIEHFQEEKYVKLLDDFPSYINEDYNHLSEPIKNVILNQIYDITREVFSAYENEYTIFSPMSNCFELFGLDFIVDNELNVSLLEINPGPDFKQTGNRLKQVITDLWDQTLSLVIDKDIYNMKSDDIDYSYRDFNLVYTKSWSSSQFKGGMSLN